MSTGVGRGLKIGISTSVIQRGQTGVAQYLFALLHALLPISPHQLTLFVLEEDLPLFNFASDQVRFEAVPERFRDPVKNILWHQTKLPKLSRQHQLEVLHVPSYRRLLWPKPCALVATIHDLAPFRVPGKYDWKRMFYGRFVVRQLARRQDRIITVSENTARDVVACFRLPPGRIQVIHNGLDHGRFMPGKTETAQVEVARRYGLRQPFFLYVARLEHPGKNHVRLIAAFEEFKRTTRSNWQLAFGGSDWHRAEEIHRRVRQSPVAADIRCLGFVPDADLPGLYRAAGAMVYPSLYEGFGMPPLEAMACGCPVISSARGALGEVVGAAAVIVDPEDTRSMARQLCRMATDTEARQRLRAAGLERARQFDWRRTAEQTLKIYESTFALSGFRKG